MTPPYSSLGWWPRGGMAASAATAAAIAAAAAAAAAASAANDVTGERLFGLTGLALAESLATGGGNVSHHIRHSDR